MAGGGLETEAYRAERLIEDLRAMPTAPRLSSLGGLTPAQLAKEEEATIPGIGEALADEGSGTGSPRAKDRKPTAAGHQAIEVGEPTEELQQHWEKFAFVQGESFQVSMITIIMLNLWALAMEADDPGWPFWDVTNSIFVVVYLVEFAMRIAYWKGPSGVFWYSTHEDRMWLSFDLLVLLFALMDWGVVLSTGGSSSEQANPLLLHLQRMHANHSVANGSSSGAGKDETERRLLSFQPLTSVATVRFLMFTRLLRVLRIVRMHPPLYDFVKLLYMMLQTFVWILAIIFLCCFVLAIIMTRLVGHGLLLQTDNKEAAAQARSMFKDVPTSLYTLFQLTTADDWGRIASPLVSISTLWRIFFIVFITFMTWTMLSLLTAVASETMISASSSKKSEEESGQEQARKKFEMWLRDRFFTADLNHNGTLDYQEFEKLMGDGAMKEEMKLHGLIPIEERDIPRLWKTFDQDDSNALDIEELVKGFMVMQEGLATKHVASVAYSLKRFGNSMETRIQQLETYLKSMGSHKASVMRNVMKQHQAFQDHWSSFLRDLDEAPRRPGRASAPKSAPSPKHSPMPRSRFPG